MKPTGVRVNLRHLMVLVATLSLMFAMLGVVGGTMATLFLVLMTWPLTLDTSSKQMEGWAWSTALFPTLVVASLMATWLAARFSLGHEPDPTEFRRPYPTPLIVGARITTSLLSLFVPFSFVACAFLSVAATKRRSIENPNANLTRNAVKSAFWPLLWVSGFAILVWDPFLMAKSVLR